MVPRKGVFSGRNLDPKEERRRRSVHKRARSDQHAANILGIPRITYTIWRERRGLSPHQPDRQEKELKRRKRILAKTTGVPAAARQLHVSHQALYQWMRRHGIKPKPVPKGPSVDEKEIQRRLRIIRDSKSVPEAARRMNRSIGVVYQLVRDHGLKPPGSQ